MFKYPVSAWMPQEAVKSNLPVNSELIDLLWSDKLVVDFDDLKSKIKSFNTLNLLPCGGINETNSNSISNFLTYFSQTASLTTVLELFHSMSNYSKNLKPTLIGILDKNISDEPQGYNIKNNLFFDIVGKYYPINNHFSWKFARKISHSWDITIMCLPKKHIDKKNQNTVIIPSQFLDKFKADCIERINFVLKSNNLNDLFVLSELRRYLNDYQLKRLQTQIQLLISDEKIVVEWLKYSPSIYWLCELNHNIEQLPQSVQNNVKEIYEYTKKFSLSDLVSTSETYLASNWKHPLS